MIEENKQKFIGEGLTYDDVLLVPAYSEILPHPSYALQLTFQEILK